MPKKKILLLTTGGTIASHKTEYGLAPALTAEEILDFLPSMSSICHLEARNQYRQHQYDQRPLDADRRSH